MNISVTELSNTDEGYVIKSPIMNEHGEFNLHAVTITNELYDNILLYKIYHKNLQHFEEYLNEIFELYNDKVNLWVLIVDYGEAFSSVSKDAIYDTPHMKYIINYFKNKGLLDKLVWRSNGLNPQFESEVKFEPISFWLGKNTEFLMEISPRKFDYTFLSLYRGYKVERESFHNFLQDSGILSKTLYSYNSEFMFDDQSHWTNDYAVSLDNNESVSAKKILEPGPYFKNTFCSLVYEALFKQKVVFPTEKTNKCFLAGHPFIVLSTPRFLHNIKKIGFKTFDQWWDESYDMEKNDENRVLKIQKLVTEISTWDLDKCEKVYEEMIPTLIHNQNIIKKLSNFNRSDTYNVLDIEVDSYKKPML